MHPNTQQEYTEQELITSFRQGKPEALELLYDKYAPVLLGLATRIMRDSETAEVVLQDAFVSIWEHKADYDATQLSLLSWMILILRDIAMVRLKSEKYKTVSESAELLNFAGETKNNKVRQVNKEVKASFCNLELNEKLAIDLVYLKGYSCSQAAAELGVTEDTVKAWLKLGCKHLKRKKNYLKSIQAYIESGILELFVMGATSPEESAEVEQMAVAHYEVRQEIDAISRAMESYAVTHAVEPKGTIKPLLLATIDYMERLKKGEPAENPPALTSSSNISDYAAWLNRSDMVLPADNEGIYVKLIGATPAAITAIVWLSGTADNEIHHDEYERFLIVEGSCDITVGTQVNQLSPGDFFAIPLHIPHTVEVTSAIPCKVILQRLAA